MNDLAASPSADAAAYAMIPIASLELAPDNPRSQTSVDEKAIADLAENISALGLLTPLIGYRYKTKVFVTAGGRRLRALRRLVDLKMLPEEHPVPVLVSLKNDAVTAGIGEQLTHAPLTALDEILAFKNNPSLSDAEAARIFGKSVTVVRQRRAVLKLPDWIMNKVMAGELAVDQAYGLTYWQDVDRDELEPFVAKVILYNFTLNQIRSAYTSRVRPFTNFPQHQLVTQEDYLAMGGKLQKDLFSDDAFVLDPAILTGLIENAVIAQAKNDLPGYGSYSVATDDIWHVRRNVRIYPSPDPVFTEDETLQIEALHAEMQAIEKKAEVDGFDPDEEDRFYDLETQVDAITSNAAAGTIPSDILAQLGVIIFIGRSSVDYLPNIIIPGTDLERELVAAESLQLDSDEADSEHDPEPKEQNPFEPSGSQIARIRDVIQHVQRQELAASPDNVIGLYLRHLAGDPSLRFVFDARPFLGWDNASGYSSCSTSKSWDTCFELASLPAEDIAGKSASMQRKALCARLLMCLTRAAPGFDPAAIRSWFTPDVEWFSYYTKTQLLHIATTSAGRSNLDATGVKKATLAAICAEWAASPAGKDYLPPDFDIVLSRRF